VTLCVKRHDVVAKGGEAVNLWRAGICLPTFFSNSLSTWRERNRWMVSMPAICASMKAYLRTAHSRALAPRARSHSNAAPHNGRLQASTASAAIATARSFASLFATFFNPSACNASPCCTYSSAADAWAS